MNKLPFELKSRELITKTKFETNPEYGCSPESRKIQDYIDYGVLNLNKPAGPTSHLAADYVKKILHLDKVGHGGSLDPNVTGCLPIALSKATRVVQSLLSAGKEYICWMHIHKEASEADIKKTFEFFKGKITQLPPLKSAVKRQLRERNVYYLDILDIENQEVLFKVGCQAGTYIRKICSDFGKKLGTQSHMQQLIRTKAGPFSQDSWISLQDLKDAYELYKEGDESYIRKVIQPYENAVAHLPKVYVFDSAVANICHGAEVYVSGVSKFNKLNSEEQVAIMTLKDELIGLGTSKMSTEEILSMNKGVSIKTEAVFMQPDLYPRMHKA